MKRPIEDSSSGNVQSEMIIIEFESVRKSDAFLIYSLLKYKCFIH